VSPAAGACFGPAALPVAIADTFADGCDPVLSKTYQPAPGPLYQTHGDQLVTVTASDRSGNAASDSVSFTIDTVPPSVALHLSGALIVLPGAVPLQPLLSASDDDGASGGVVHETLSINGCLAYDGDTIGNRDGLLTDETIYVDRAELCRIIRTCGLGSMVAPVLTFEASDCGHNVGRVSRSLYSGTISRDDVCDPQLNPETTAPRRQTIRQAN